MLPYVFVGDETFSLRADFMKPYPQKELNRERRIFNYRLSRARRIVENVFGILASKFRVFHTAINLKLESIEKVVMACIALHNYLHIKCTSTYLSEATDSRAVTDLSSKSTILAGLQHGQEAKNTEIAKNQRKSFWSILLKVHLTGSTI